MRDLARPQTLSQLTPGPALFWRRKGPIRFCLDDQPERERPTLLRERFAGAGVHYEFRALRDAPFRVRSRSTAASARSRISTGRSAAATAWRHRTCVRRRPTTAP
jgi:hypothetical protein